jgi:hypothetical protein
LSTNLAGCAGFIGDEQIPHVKILAQGAAYEKNGFLCVFIDRVTGFLGNFL